MGYLKRSNHLSPIYISLNFERILRKRWKRCLSLSPVWETRERENGRREHGWVRARVRERDQIGTRSEQRVSPAQTLRSSRETSRAMSVVLCCVVSMWSTIPSRFDCVHWLLDRSWQFLHSHAPPKHQLWHHRLHLVVAGEEPRREREKKEDSGVSAGGARVSWRQSRPGIHFDPSTMPLLYPSLIFQVFLSFLHFLCPGVEGLRFSAVGRDTLVSDEVLGHWGGRGMPLIAYFQRVLRKAGNTLLWHGSNKCTWIAHKLGLRPNVLLWIHLNGRQARVHGGILIRCSSFGKIVSSSCNLKRTGSGCYLSILAA